MTRCLLGTKRSKLRCIYENNKIVVEHFVASFQDGSREALLTVNLLKSGLLWRTETGATPLDRYIRRLHDLMLQSGLNITSYRINLKI